MDGHWYCATRGGDRMGPLPLGDLRALIRGGCASAVDVVWAPHLTAWTLVGQVPELADVAPPQLPTPDQGAEDARIIQTLEGLELLSAIAWLVIASVQVILSFRLFGSFAFLAVAGIWNAYVGVSRLMRLGSIRERNPGVVVSHEGISRLVATAAINVVFGALIGALWVAVDVIIRDRVLRHRALFRGKPVA